MKGGPYEDQITDAQKSMLSSNIERVCSRMSFLCPYGIESMIVRGGLGSLDFDYVKVAVEGCDLGPEECMPDS